MFDTHVSNWVSFLYSEMFVHKYDAEQWCEQVCYLAYFRQLNPALYWVMKRGHGKELKKVVLDLISVVYRAFEGLKSLNGAVHYRSAETSTMLCCTNGKPKIHCRILYIFCWVYTSVQYASHAQLSFLSTFRYQSAVSPALLRGISC